MVRALWGRIADRAAPSGDDCAFVDVGEARLAISGDLSIEGTHFRLGWLALHEIGWRAAAASLSDLAAVAATPVGIMVGIGISPEWPSDSAAEVMEGAAAAAAAVDAVVLGGDIVRSENLVLDVTAIGRLASDPVERRGARVGDALYVTGRLGGPAAALAAWEAGREPESSARERFAHPEPRIAQATWLRDQGVHAMVDLSDGLLADAQHLAAASSVRCALDLAAVPLHPAAESPERALAGGEEYELLVAAPEGEAMPEAFGAAFDLPLTRVGRVEEGLGVEVRRDGAITHVISPFRQFG
ncbi:MAG: thiamine-phosphate kinase [Gemmatimonadetes bacterium]|nr:thiamine-phosphate kinase [Gemmatimonadota bacterium]